MYPETRGERIASSQSLVCFLQALSGQNVVVELKNEVAVEGILASCDCSMNMILKDATVYRRRIKGSTPVKIEEVGIQARYVRFVHPTKKIDVLPLIRRSVNELLGRKKARRHF
uniref:Sm domain-containing protein n=1 Tax=Steinernema glaseri TaxID=37863 RepID=A0A1I8AFQ9_9BILA